MRRTFQFCVLTPLLSLVIHVLGSMLLWLCCIPIAGQTLAAAPITPSGLNTQVSGAIVTGSGATQTTQYNITGGTRPGSGTNLFHSFGDFNVPNNNIVNFLNNSGLSTSNILGRVTGGNASNIFGTIQTTGFGNANLFLMNPAGFLFGPNATVNVGGMAAFTSADYLRLTDGILFNALPNAAADALLSAAPVAAFGFLGSNSGSITVQGTQLSVTPGQSISLVGGNITIQSGTLDNGMVQPAVLSALGGQINLASAASPGEILAGTMGQATNINGQSFGNLGAIQISQQSVIDVSGNGGGTVLIRGGQFLLDNSSISANITSLGPITNGVESIGSGIDIVVSQHAVIQNGAVLETNISGNATAGIQYGGVRVRADRIEIFGSQDFDFTGIRSIIAPGSTGGNSGNLTLEANSILMQNPPNSVGTTFIQSITQGAGNSANIVMTAANNLQIDGKSEVSSNSTADFFGPGVDSIISGNAGNISLTSTTGNILLTNGAFVSSQTPFGDSSGNPGNITLTAPSGNINLTATGIGNNRTTLFTHHDDSSNASSTGAIQLTAKNLELVNSGIQGDNFTPEVPGNITVNVTGSVNLSGTGFPSRFITATRGPAPSSSLNITAHDISITDGGFLSTQTFSGGAAGALKLSTQNLQLTDGSQLRSSSVIGPQRIGFPPPIPPSGTGGIITIQGLAGAAESVLVDGAGSGMFTNTQGFGAGGNINILANTVMLQNGGTLSAATSSTAPGAGHGGTITVNANQVQLNSGGFITASTTGAGAGGSVTIGAGSTFSSNAATISSTATQATGGDIAITAGQSVTLANGASVSASSTGAGNAGNIQVNAGQSFLATNSSVTTEASHASGGTIKITTDPGGTVQLSNSLISASVLDGSGGGGSVNIDPQVVLLQNSQILANAVQGPGGNILITTNLLLPDSSSVIKASSQFGQNGTITIQSPISPAGGKIIPISQRPLLATALLSQRCAALASGEFSSFTVAGRDTLPAEPGGWLSTPLTLFTSTSGSNILTQTSSVTRADEPDGDNSLLSLRQIAPPGFLTQAFAVDWSVGCTS